MNQEIDHLRAFNTGMSLTIGILRGMLSCFQNQLNEEQLDMLSNIDKNISLLFHDHQLKEK